MVEPRTIVAVLPSLAGGGAESVTLNLLRALDRSRFRPSLIVLDRKGPLDRVDLGDIPVADLGCARLSRALPTLLGRLHRLSPAYVFSTLGYVNVALAACRSLFKGRLVLREANLPSLSLPHSNRPALTRAGYRLFYRQADLVLASSRRMKDELEALGTPSSAIRILPNPVREAVLRQEAGRAVRASGAGIRLAAAGRLTFQKGFDRLIEMLATIPGTHLTLLGGGPQRNELEALARRHGVSVDFPGFVHDAAGWLAAADAVVIPSRWEGMPNVALESLACGVKVIATPEAGGIAELADAAPPGAVTVASFGPDFAAALRAVTPRLPSLADSLLPPEYEAHAVARRFESLLDELIA